MLLSWVWTGRCVTLQRKSVSWAYQTQTSPEGLGCYVMNPDNSSVQYRLPNIACCMLPLNWCSCMRCIRRWLRINDRRREWRRLTQIDQWVGLYWSVYLYTKQHYDLHSNFKYNRFGPMALPFSHHIYATLQNIQNNTHNLIAYQYAKQCAAAMLGYLENMLML